VVGYGFQVGYIEELVAGDAVIRGYPIPVADDVDIDLRCCPDEFTGLEDFGNGWGGAYFDTDRGEIISVGCLCTA
jgi:hypothetical protein